MHDGALDYALERVKSFVKVHAASTAPERVEAVRTSLEGLGITDPDVLFERAGEVAEGESRGPFLLGVIFGLYMRQYFD